MEPPNMYHYLCNATLAKVIRHWHRVVDLAQVSATSFSGTVRGVVNNSIYQQSGSQTIASTYRDSLRSTGQVANPSLRTRIVVFLQPLQEL